MEVNAIFGIILACGIWCVISVVAEFVESNGHLIWTPKDIYDLPNNKFVGGFIGTPPMNFIHGKISEEGIFTAKDRDYDLLVPEYQFNKKSVRGIWVSNVVNIDTPKMTDEASYKEYLVNMVKTIASYNMNLMIFQVRPTNDAYYPSAVSYTHLTLPTILLV